ncbi:MAG: class I SAM-dependent methyltransferase [Acidobacteria bacterium]|nr:class I SAM-dependent methyltransferase [Acidobacteriota bacterium]
MQNLLKTSALQLEDRLPVTIAERTRRVYDRVSAVYPLSTMFFHSKAHKAALAESEIRDGRQVLEIATGSGEMFRRLVKANPSGTTIGLDLSPNMAARTQKQVREEFPSANARCQAVDARYLPFRSESFDAVVCCYLLELLSSEDVHLTLSEIRRVLRPRGSLTLVMIGENTKLFNMCYRVVSSIVPAFWGRQIEQQVPEFLSAHKFNIVTDQMVRQSFYPSRVMSARK